MNYGIQEVRGEYLIHLHADDLFHDTNVLQDVDLFLTQHPVDWIYSQVQIVERDGAVVGCWPKKRIYHHASDSRFGKYLLKFFNYLPHQAMFVKKEMFDRFGMFDETLTSAMDPDMWLRVKDKTTWTYMDRVIAKFCVRSDAQSSSQKKQKENTMNYQRVQERYLAPWERVCAKWLNVGLRILFHNDR